MSKQHGPKLGQQVQLPSKELIVDRQFSMLISGAAALYNLLCVGRANEREMPTKGGSDGGTDWAIQTTIINMMNRLDRVIADEAMWDTKEYLDLQKNAKEMMERQVEFMQQQAHASAQLAETQRMARSPHLLHHPALVRLKSGLFAAILGEIGSENAVYGVGRSPAEALDNFDAVFCGRMPEFMRQWTEQQERLENEQKKLDSGRDSGTPPTKTSRTTPPRNRRKVKPDDKIGGTETQPPPKKIITPDDDPDAFREHGGNPGGA